MEKSEVNPDQACRAFPAFPVVWPRSATARGTTTLNGSSGPHVLLQPPRCGIGISPRGTATSCWKPQTISPSTFPEGAGGGGPLLRQRSSATFKKFETAASSPPGKKIRAALIDECASIWNASTARIDARRPYLYLGEVVHAEMAKEPSAKVPHVWSGEFRSFGRHKAALQSFITVPPVLIRCILGAWTTRGT